VAPTGHAESGDPLSGRWTDVFRHDGAVHTLIITSIAAATFQGWLKDRIAGPLPYALADLSLMAAAVIWFGSMALRRAPLIGPGHSVPLMLLLLLVPAIYLIHPGSPLVIELAGLRAWSLFPMAGLMALTTIRTRGQVRAYVGLILILCVITAVYGIVQYRAGPQAALSVSALAKIRHGASIFYDIAGQRRSEFRAFSTFTFPAPFAGMMVFGILLAAGLATSRALRRSRRLLAAGLVPLFFLGMTVSGTRAAVLILALGLLVLGWYRGLSIGQLALIPLLLFAVHLGTVFTAGAIVSRWQTVALQEGLLWTYVWAPLTVAGRAIAEHPLGFGLGRSGVGVPFQIFQSMPEGFFRGSDGDIGRAGVELGIVGLVLLAVLVLGLLPYAARAARSLGATRSEPMAAGLAAVVVSTGLVLLIGSPLTSAPHGTIWWFFLGALLKLALLETGGREDGRT
jgi:hypothetical protein